MVILLVSYKCSSCTKLLKSPYHTNLWSAKELSDRLYTTSQYFCSTICTAQIVHVMQHYFCGKTDTYTILQETLRANGRCRLHLATSSILVPNQVILRLFILDLNLVNKQCQRFEDTCLGETSYTLEFLSTYTQDGQSYTIDNSIDIFVTRYIFKSMHIIVI